MDAYSFVTITCGNYIVDPPNLLSYECLYKINEHFTKKDTCTCSFIVSRLDYVSIVNIPNDATHLW